MTRKKDTFDPKLPYIVMDCGKCDAHYAYFTSPPDARELWDRKDEIVMVMKGRTGIIEDVDSWLPDGCIQVVIEYAHMAVRKSMRSKSQVFFKEELDDFYGKMKERGVKVYLFNNMSTPSVRKEFSKSAGLSQTVKKTDKSDVCSLAWWIGSDNFKDVMMEGCVQADKPKEESPRYVYRQETNLMVDYAKNYGYMAINEHTISKSDEFMIYPDNKDYVSEFIVDKACWVKGDSKTTQLLANDIFKYLDRKEKSGERAMRLGLIDKYTMTQVYPMVACIMDPRTGGRRSLLGDPVYPDTGMRFGYTKSPYHFRSGVASAHIKNFRTRKDCKGKSVKERREIQSGHSAICNSIMQFVSDYIDGKASVIHGDASASSQMAKCERGSSSSQRSLF